MQRDLVELARQGDHAAFTALVTGSINGLYATARLILRSDDLADDAVQDALLRAWLGIRGRRTEQHRSVQSNFTGCREHQFDDAGARFLWTAG